VVAASIALSHAVFMARCPASAQNGEIGRLAGAGSELLRPPRSGLPTRPCVSRSRRFPGSTGGCCERTNRLPFPLRHGSPTTCRRLARWIFFKRCWLWPFPTCALAGRSRGEGFKMALSTSVCRPCRPPVLLRRRPRVPPSAFCRLQRGGSLPQGWPRPPARRWGLHASARLSWR